MTPGARAVALVVLAVGLAGCGNPTIITPLDPQYARTGAPRAGEADISPENTYGRIMAPDGNGPN